ncbi:hypothetical protein AXF42_Ash006726 [Apostasia shenzhenica]|uniref:DUF4218 domain-containing protein n=1 Tax=Apostasia shenzhenica TaxID=1088818 RepID=A0A2I0AIX8_9ASPA|nr:hypothetical protein AXF42_Ash006726 [Apostasia shenzhenica]
MYVEKNIFDNIFNTIMDVKGKTKDNAKARADLPLYCKRFDLELTEINGKVFKPPATYALSKEKLKIVCEWIKKLKFPDGYVSYIARCVYLQDQCIYGMKSHDCHVFMQRLLPIAFRELLPYDVWSAITEISFFFRNICAHTISEVDMKNLEKSIVITLCKLEKIFPPAFFNCMEHLPIHLVYEARVAGPVQ